MNAILDRIDDAMLSLAQKISDAIDNSFAIDHWTVASGILRLGVGCILVSTAITLGLSRPGAIGFTVMSLFSFLWFFIYRGLADRLKRQRASRDAGRALKVSERRTRSIDLVLCIFICLIHLPQVDMSDMIFMGAIACFHVHYYFKAADLPPPSTSNRVAWSG